MRGTGANTRSVGPGGPDAWAGPLATDAPTTASDASTVKETRSLRITGPPRIVWTRRRASPVSLTLSDAVRFPRDPALPSATGKDIAAVRTFVVGVLGLHRIPAGIAWQPLRPVD